MKKYYYNVRILLDGKTLVDTVQITVDARSKYAANKIANRMGNKVIQDYDTDCLYELEFQYFEV